MVNFVVYDSPLRPRPRIRQRSSFRNLHRYGARRYQSAKPVSFQPRIKPSLFLRLTTASTRKRSGRERVGRASRRIKGPFARKRDLPSDAAGPDVVKLADGPGHFWRTMRRDRYEIARAKNEREGKEACRRSRTHSGPGGRPSICCSCRFRRKYPPRMYWVLPSPPPLFLLAVPRLSPHLADSTAFFLYFPSPQHIYT